MQGSKKEKLEFQQLFTFFKSVPLFKNIRHGWNRFTVTNTLSYYGEEDIAITNRFNSIITLKHQTRGKDGLTLTKEFMVQISHVQFNY